MARIVRSTRNQPHPGRRASGRASILSAALLVATVSLNAQPLPENFVPSYVSLPEVRLGDVESAYVPYDASNADLESAVGPVPGIVEVPVYGRNAGDALGLLLSVDYDQIFLNCVGFRKVSDAWIPEQVTRINDAASGSLAKIPFKRYSEREPVAEDEEFLIGYIQFGLNAMAPAQRPPSPYASQVGLSGSTEEASSYYYTIGPDGKEQRLHTDLTDGSISIHFRDRAELGSLVVSPVEQDLALPLYLTVLDPDDDPLQVTVDYDQIFLWFKEARPVVPGIFRGSIASEDGSGAAGTVRLTMTLDRGTTDGSLLRRHVADLVFAYSGGPDEGPLSVSAQLATTDSAPAEPKDKNGDRGWSIAQVRVGSPYFVRGNVASRYSVTLDGGRIYHGTSLRDVTLIFQDFVGSGDLPCEVAADADANGDVEITDAILLLGYLFGSGPPPRDPFPEPGWLGDQETELRCERSLPYYALTR